MNGCGWKHHTMLHIKKKNNNISTPPNHPAVTSEDTGASTISGAGRLERVLSVGLGMLVGVVLQTLARRMFV